MSSKSIYTVLDDLGIQYTEVKHPALFTSAEGEAYWKDIPGIKTKNLFLRNRKGNVHYLAIVPVEKRVDLKRLAKELGEVQLGFASPERLLKHLGLTPGSVTPFGLINDTDHSVRVLLDKQVAQAEEQAFHPNINTATLCLKTRDLLKFLDWTGCSVQTVEL